MAGTYFVVYNQRQHTCFDDIRYSPLSILTTNDVWSNISTTDWQQITFIAFFKLTIFYGQIHWMHLINKNKHEFV